MKSLWSMIARYVLPVFVVCFATPTYADSLIGITAGLPSSTGHKSTKTFSENVSTSLVFGINGESKYSFESGFSQIASIEDDYTNDETLEVSVSGIYISGRYTTEFSQSGFVFLKLGIYRWTADTVEKLDGNSNTFDNRNSNISKKTVSGFSPMLAVGADFLMGSDASFALRIEYEYIDKIAGGVRLQSDNRVRDISESYAFGKLSVGVLLAL